MNLAVCLFAALFASAVWWQPFFERMSSKAAYVRPIQDLSVVAGRVAEQVCGRVVHHFTETFKRGSSKTVAVIVDGQSLRSVLVLEAWSLADQGHMKQTLIQYAGQVVSISNFKLQSKGRSLVYFDRDLKVAFDKNTTVKLSTGDFPDALPLLPNVKDATLCNGPCMVSMQVVLLEDPVTSEAKMQAGGTKQVCNAKVASGECSLNVAFWHPLSENMTSASKNGVFRLDWMMLIPDGPGKFKLTSGSGSSVQQQIGDVAEEIRQKLAVVDDIQSLSANYGKSREEKLRQMFSVGSLTTLHHIMHLDLATGVYQGKSMMIPAVFVKDIRGMNSENSDSLWYLGCTQCKKQLQQDMTGGFMCETHGTNAGKRVYGAQVLFADPTRTLEAAVWEDALRALAVAMVDASFDMDKPEETQKLLAAALTQKMCVRVEFGVNKAGTGMYYDLFDISAQVTEDGVCGAFKALTEDVFFGNPGIVPACCKNIKMNDHAQLQVHVDDKALTVDSVHILCQVRAKPNVKVMQEMDGLEIHVPCVCSVCGAHMTLVAAGVAMSVQEIMMAQQKTWLSVLCQRRWANGMFLVAQFTEEKQAKKLEMLQKVFKFESKQECLQALGCQRPKGKLTTLRICLRSNDRPSVSRFRRLKKEKTCERLLQ